MLPSLGFAFVVAVDRFSMGDSVADELNLAGCHHPVGDALAAQRTRNFFHIPSSLKVHRGAREPLNQPSKPMEAFYTRIRYVYYPCPNTPFPIVVSFGDRQYVTDPINDHRHMDSSENYDIPN